MDNALYFTVKSLLMPPGGLILLFVVGLVLVRGVLGRVIIFIALTILGLMSLPIVSAGLLAGLETYPALAPSQLAKTDAQAILVLGADRYTWAPEYGGDSLGASSLQRLRYGAFVHRRTGLPLYITGGSPVPESPPLGRLMSKVLEGEFGITAAGVEDRSLTTEENARLSAPMLARDGISHVLLVTHAWHMPRSVDIFERVGVRVTPAPTCLSRRGAGEGTLKHRDWLPNARALFLSYVALHEWIGQVWYQLKAPAQVDQAAKDIGGVPCNIQSAPAVQGCAAVFVHASA